MAGTSGRQSLPTGWRAPARTWLHRVERVFLAIALVALGWYAAAWIGGRLSELEGTRELQELSALRPVSTPTPDAVGRSTPPPAASVVGRIVIPRLDLSAIVREGVDARTLRRAVGHVPGTALPGEPGNAALAGHRDTFFQQLKDVRRGDRVMVETPRGTFEYIVRDTRVVEPTTVSVLDPTAEQTLTLVTCYPFNFIGTAPQRFIVRATSETDAARR